MGIADRVNKKARQRLEAQLIPGEQVLLSSNLAASALVLTNQRLMVAPAIAGAEPDISLPLAAVQNVAWQKGHLGNPGMLSVYTGSQVHSYKVRNKEGETTAQQIRQALTARG